MVNSWRNWSYLRSRSSAAVFSSFFFSSRRRHTRSDRDWSSDVCSSDLRCHPDNLPNLPDTCLFFNAENDDCVIEPMQTAVYGVYRSVTIAPNKRCITADQLLLKTTEAMRHVLLHCLANGDSIKVFTSTETRMQKINVTDGSVEKEDVCYFTNKATPIQTEADITTFIDNYGKKLDASIEKFTTKGSNWVVASIDNISLRLVKYRLLRGGAAGSFELPPELTNKKCVLNIDSSNNECFKYAVVAGLHHGEIADNKNRHNNYVPFMENY